MKMRERWKDISGYEGRYQVSDRGRVRSLPRAYSPKLNYLKPKRDKDGYLEVCLYCKYNTKNYKKVHRLVFEAFLGDLSPEMQVNHENGKKHDNRFQNLTQMTAKENTKHAIDNQLRNRYGKISKEDIPTIRFKFECGFNCKVIAAEYQVPPSRIYKLKKQWLKQGLAL